MLTLHPDIGLRRPACAAIPGASRATVIPSLDGPRFRVVHSRENIRRCINWRQGRGFLVASHFNSTINIPGIRETLSPVPEENKSKTAPIEGFVHQDGPSADKMSSPVNYIYSLDLVGGEYLDKMRNEFIPYYVPRDPVSIQDGLRKPRSYNRKRLARIVTISYTYWDEGDNKANAQSCKTTLGSWEHSGLCCRSGRLRLS